MRRLRLSLVGVVAISVLLLSKPLLAALQIDITSDVSPQDDGTFRYHYSVTNNTRDFNLETFFLSIPVIDHLKSLSGPPDWTVEYHLSGSTVLWQLPNDLDHFNPGITLGTKGEFYFSSLFAPDLINYSIQAFDNNPDPPLDPASGDPIYMDDQFASGFVSGPSIPEPSYTCFVIMLLAVFVQNLRRIISVKQSVLNP